MNHTYQNIEYTYIKTQKQADEYEKTKRARVIAIALNSFVPGSKTAIFIEKLCNSGRAHLGSPTYFNDCKTPEEVVEVIAEKKIDLSPVIVDLD